MQIKTARRRSSPNSRKPLVVDEIALPDALDAGQVLVKVLYTTICGAQINEIDAVKGPDKFLPHLLGHEASAEVIEIGPGVTDRQARRHGRAALASEPGHPEPGRPPIRGAASKLNAGWVTTFNEYAVVSENRMTVIPADYDLKVAPLFGCAVTTAAGVINNDAKVKIGESVVIFGVGGVGLNVVQFAAARRRHPIVAVDLLDHKLEMARRRGATHCINAAKVADVAAAIRAIVGDKGPDKVIETTGVKDGHRAGLRPDPPGRHLRAGRRAERKGHDLHAADPFQQGADRLARRRRQAAYRHSAHHPPGAGRASVVRRASSRTSFRLGDINAALDLVRSGKAGRVLVKAAQA